MLQEDPRLNNKTEVTTVMAWLAEDKKRITEFFNRLDAGFWDEWDCDLMTGVQMFGFDSKETQLAMRAGTFG